MAREFFKNYPDTTTPLSAERINGLLDGDEAMGNLVVDSIKNKNMFNEKEILNINTWAKNNDGYYTGPSVDIRSYFINKDYTNMFEENTRYTFKWTGYLGTATNVRMKFVYTDNTTSSTSGMSSTSPFDYYVTSEINKTIKSLEIDYGNSGTFFIKNIQLEKGTSSTTYIPYQELNSYVNDTEWIDLTLQNGVTAREGTQYKPQCRRIGSVVYLKGQVNIPSHNNNIDIFTLPVGFRPICETRLPLVYKEINNWLGTSGTFYVSSSGSALSNVSIDWFFLVN